MSTEFYVPTHNTMITNTAILLLFFFNGFFICLVRSVAIGNGQNVRQKNLCGGDYTHHDTTPIKNFNQSAAKYILLVLRIMWCTGVRIFLCGTP